MPYKILMYQILNKKKTHIYKIFFRLKVSRFKGFIYNVLFLKGSLPLKNIYFLLLSQDLLGE